MRQRAVRDTGDNWKEDEGKGKGGKDEDMHPEVLQEQEF